MNSQRPTTGSTSTADETRAGPRVESTGAFILSGASSPSVLGGEFNASQRDHNRPTFNFNINIGGSDSDTPSSALAVSNPTTSGSVEDWPHASTSSSVSDLPYSTTSPASNEEQGPPEESSVSIDSGLGGSEVSPDVESLPTEEGNPLNKESSNSIYKRHMYLEAHGFPLWIPQPNMTLPPSYQRQGVSIGDVGVFTSDGGFDFLFNVCLPAEHPNNPAELPEGFFPFNLKPTDVCKFHAHLSQSHLASRSVKRREATFECSGTDGAILVMPQGAYHEDLKNIMTFREYVSIYAESWYVYAKGRGRQVRNKELRVVTGCDKTTSWGIATYSHLQSNRPEDNVSFLRFNPAGNEHQGRHSPYEWDYAGVLEAKSGPEEDELMDLGVNGSLPLRNQCTFIRTHTLAIGVDNWEHLELKVAALVKDQASVRSLKSPFLSVSGAISSLSNFLRGYSRGGSSEVTDSMIPAQTTATHPATYVIDMMLRKCPKAKVVVVHDSDWCSVIRDSDVDWTCTAQDLPHRVQEAFHIVEEKNGTVYLEEKARPSQELSTSSDVSVRAEVEDCPLPGNRKLSPSQFFNPFISMASLNESDNHRRFQDEDVLLDPDNLQPDVACLEFIRLQIQSVKNEASFKESFSTPQSLKMSADDCDDDSNLNSSQGHLGLEMDHKENFWTDAFQEYLSMQIQKLGHNSSYDNKFSMDRDSSQGPFKLDTNDLDEVHRFMLINIMNVMLWGLNPNEEPADDDNGDAKSDLFEYAIPASLKYLEGKLIHRGSELHIHAPSDDEVYSISHATLPVPTSQTYEWWNADGGDVMPYINFSSSSGPSPYRLPLEKESSGGSARGRLGLSAANSLNHHALETSNQPHETNFRNPLSLVDSLEPEDATGGIIMSDSTFGTEYEASISDLFGDRGTDLLADEDLPLAHSRSGTVASQEQTAEIVEIVASEPVAETEQRRNRHGRFNCPLCARTFTMTSTMMYHLRSHIKTHFGHRTHSSPHCQAAPEATPLPPEWHNLVHRNYYGRRRLQMVDNQQRMLREFVLISMRDSADCVNRMRDYLGRREMPRHLHIAPESVIDMEGYRALVTPHYKNGNILEFINKRVVSDGRKLQLIMQTAQGLAYLHSLDIVHGNLYPANILVTDDWNIVLTDAGIYTEVVKLMLKPSGRLCIPNSLVYKSYRELDGEEAPTKSTDVYEFASTWYAIMTGRAPFSEIANPYLRLLEVAKDGHMTLPRPPSTSPTLWDLLMECWSAEPKERPTMSEVVYCLGRATRNRAAHRCRIYDVRP